MINESLADIAVPSWVSPDTRYHLLADALHDLGSARTLDDVIEIVRSSARAISGAAGIAIVLRDGDQCHYVAEDAEAPLWAGQRFPMVHCISGWAMLNRQSAIIEDITLDARIPQDAYAATFVRSLVMTPIGDEPFAALGAYWGHVRTPQSHEIEMLALLARATATAFKNAELYQSLEREAKRNAALNRDLLERIREREEAEAAQVLIVRELNHRARNMMSVVQSIASQTFRNTEPGEDAGEVFEARLVAMARAHGLVTSDAAAPLTLRDLVRKTVEPFDSDADRVVIIGPDVTVPRRSAITMALAIHELATNAVKYGALSEEDGRVVVRWAVTGDQDAERLSWTWREEGGPKVGTPTRRGFGSQLIEHSLAAELKGTVKLSYRSEGLLCALDAPFTAAERDRPSSLI